MQIVVEGRPMVARPLYSREQIENRVATLAAQINRESDAEACLTVLIVLHGAFLFAADLVRGLAMPTLIETIRLRSYHGTQSSGVIEAVTPLPADLKGKDVLIVEDIVDTGKSLAYLRQALEKAQVARVRVACLLDKPDAHDPALTPEYVGFSIGKNFVIGYGLDLDGKYRNLPYVAELVPQTNSPA